jgi:outer membrane protein TolC
VRVTQPLLKNAGPLVTEAQIIIAQYNNQVSAEAFRLQVMTQVATAIQLYYELMFTVWNVDVSRISLAQAEELLRVNTAQFNAGVVPELDVLQAKADVASRQQDVIKALQDVENASDNLKLQLAEMCDMRDISLRPSEVPEVPDYEIKEQLFVDQALAYRPELEQAKLEIETQNINVRVAQNQTLPQVDLFASFLGVGVESGHSDAIDSIDDSNRADWTLGLQFSYALQNRTARYRFHEAEKQFDTALLQLRQVQETVVYNLRTSIRAVETNRENISVGRATVEFNKSKVDTGQKRQAVGLVTSFDVLAFQRDLADARRELLRSVVDYNKAIVALEFSKGTLLDRLNIVVDEGTESHSSQIPKKPFQAAD